MNRIRKIIDDILIICLVGAFAVYIACIVGVLSIYDLFRRTKMIKKQEKKQVQGIVYISNEMEEKYKKEIAEALKNSLKE